MKKIPGNLLKTWKNHGNIMEICQFEKVGNLRKNSAKNLPLSGVEPLNMLLN